MMNQVELKYKIRKQLEENGRYLYIKDINAIVDMTFELIMESLSEGENVNIKGFGTFSTATYKEHYGRHPKDNTEFIKVPQQTRATFKTGRELKRKLNK